MILSQNNVSVLWKEWLAVFKVKAKVQNFNKCFVFPVSVNCYQPLATKLCIMMHHHESECHSKGLICYLQDQGCSEGLYIKLWLFLSLLLNFWLLVLQWNLVFFWYIVITALLCCFPYQGLGSMSVASSAVMSVIWCYGLYLPIKYNKCSCKLSCTYQWNLNALSNSLLNLVS